MRHTSLPFYCVFFSALWACGDEKGRPIGAACGVDEQCASGLCVTSMCVDPAGDLDQDLLINSIERALGTALDNPDTDGDGKSDAVEVGNPQAPTDTDGDGKIDALESAVLDADGDCVVDELDPDDTDPTVPGFACVDTCDGVLDDGEACDDGNDDPLDGCDLCVVQPLAVSRPERGPRQGLVAGLVSGGFLATWHEGRTAQSAAQAGHSVAFFDAGGVEIRRHEDINPPTTQVFYQKSVAALRGGDVVVGAWFFDGSVQTFQVRRYTDQGEPVGDTLTPYVGTRLASEIELVPVDPGAYAVVYVDPDVDSQLVIRYVDAAGNLSSIIRGRPLRGSDSVLSVAGFSDGAVVVVSRELDTNQRPTLFAKRFGSAGTQVGDDTAILPADLTELAHDVVATRDGGYAVFFATSTAVGYQKVSATDTLVGEPVFLLQDAPSDCIRVVKGAFHVGGEAFVAAEDRCEDAIRGWQESDDGVLDVELAPYIGGLHSVSASPFASGIAVQFVQEFDGDGSVFVTGFTRQGKRVLITR